MAFQAPQGRGVALFIKPEGLGGNISQLIGYLQKNKLYSLMKQQLVLHVTFFQKDDKSEDIPITAPQTEVQFGVGDKRKRNTIESSGEEVSKYIYSINVHVLNTVLLNNY